MPQTEKQCLRCGRTLPLADFPRDTNYTDDLSRWCRQCHRDYDRTRRHGSLSAYVAHACRHLTTEQLRTEIERREGN